MAMSERRKWELSQLQMKQSLDQIAKSIAEARRARKEPSSPMYTPKQALKELGERSRKRY